jgi:hypothetical protein
MRQADGSCRDIDKVELPRQRFHDNADVVEVAGNEALAK